MGGATSYKWQLDYDDNFSTVPIPLEGDTGVSSAHLTALEPATTYYWRVRVTEPLLSPWSARRSFTTSLGTPSLKSPGSGAKKVELQPVFQWSAIAGADTYELLVATDVYFANPIIDRVGDFALATTIWQWNVNLDYDTTYYWKVRAIGSDADGAWSVASVFTTKSPPVPTEVTQPPQPPLLPPSPPSAPPPTQQTVSDWVFYMTGLMGFTIILLLIAIVVLVIKIRRSQL